MRILHITDIHDAFIPLIYVCCCETYDVIAFTGDLLSEDNLVLFIDVLSALSEFASRPIIFVPGNWDPIGSLIIKHYANLYGAHSRKIIMGGYSFVGIGGSPPLVAPGVFPTEFSAEDYAFFAEKLRMLHDKHTLLMLHTDPNDVPYLKSLMRDLEPKYVLYGHIHDRRGVYAYNKTVIANPGALYEGWYSIIDTDEGVELKNIQTSNLRSAGCLISADDIIEALYFLQKPSSPEPTLKFLERLLSSVTLPLEARFLTIISTIRLIGASSELRRILTLREFEERITNKRQARFLLRVLSKVGTISNEYLESIQHLEGDTISDLLTIIAIKELGIGGADWRWANMEATTNPLEVLLFLIAFGGECLDADTLSVIVEAIEKSNLTDVTYMLLELARHLDWHGLKEILSRLKYAINSVFGLADENTKAFFLRKLRNVFVKDNIISIDLARFLIA